MTKVGLSKSVISILIFCCACTYHDLTPPTSCSTEFKYDETSGQCKNCRGEIGYNTVSFDAIRKSKNAECFYLSKLELLLLMGDSVQIPERLGYNKLTNYNFKGSVLDSCNLYFNFIYRADLRGTDLSTLQYGYAAVKGRKDNFTKDPLAGVVTVSGDSIECSH